MQKSRLSDTIQHMTVDILCRVVDNLGDIGFVYRLARGLSELPDAPRLRLIVDNLEAFASICPGVQPDEPVQTLGDWLIIRWDNPGDRALDIFQAERPRMVLECYACGRPDWLEAILFDTADTVPRNIINLEYLTAESWAPDFHMLPSLTRSPLVRKSIFMPGFARGTGGLLQDSAYMAVIEASTERESQIGLRRTQFPEFGHETAFWIPVFSYEHDFSAIVSDMASFHAEQPILALVAQGRSQALFLEAWGKAGRPFPVVSLPLLPQARWDTLLAVSDFAIIRGEESFSRAALSGHPFLWQCYPFPSAQNLQSSHGGQLPKVYAFLEAIKPYLPIGDFQAYEQLMLSFNTGTESKTGVLLAVLEANSPRPAKTSGKNQKSAFSDGFSAWAQDIRNLGNLASNLVTYMRDIG